MDYNYYRKIEKNNTLKYALPEKGGAEFFRVSFKKR